MSRWLPVGVGVVPLVWALFALDTAILGGVTPRAAAWTDPWPLLLLAMLPVWGLLAAWRRAGPVELGLAALAFAFGVNALVELPDFASSWWVFDGPALVPAYLAITAAAGAYAVAGPGSHAPVVRAAALVALWSTAGGRMFAREGETVYALLACAVLLAFVAGPLRPSPKGLLTSRAAWTVLLLLGWILAAALDADGRAAGLRVWFRCLLGALLAWTLAGGLDRRGVRAVAAALGLGVALSLGIAALGMADAVQYGSWGRVWGTRLRVYDMHANGTGPLFAIGAVLCAGLALDRTAGAARRAAWAAVALLAAVAVWKTQSRASLLGLAVGGAALALCLRFSPPARPLPWVAGLLALAGAALAAFASPLGAPLRERLHAMTTGPSALGQRYHFWEMAVAAAREHPWLGLGPNQYYAHAHYAEPSYYDGTVQTLHAHNLFLGVAEGIGWIGLALFVLFVLALLECGRRALAGSAGPADGEGRAVPAALLAAVLALLGANLLDLGQSQTTFVPLLFWFALGLFAAWLRPAGAPAAAAAAGAGRSAAALALAVPLAFLPLLGQGFHARGRAVFDDAPEAQEAALAHFERALRCDPLATRPHESAAAVCRVLGRDRRAVEHLRALCAAAPSRSLAWAELARLLLENGDAAGGRAAAAEAVRLDPLGPQAGEARLLVAWAALLEGDRAQAAASLAEGLRLQARAWGALPHAVLPPAGGDPPGARRLAFTLAGGPGELPFDGVLPFDEVLEALEAELLELAPEDDTRARRILGSVVAGYRAEGRPGRALDAVRAHAALSPGRIEATERIEIQLLMELDRVDEAEALFHASRDAGRFTDFHAAELADALLRRGAPGDVERARAAMRGVGSFDYMDFFFSAGMCSFPHDLLARLTLAEGDPAEALRQQKRAQYDRRGRELRFTRAQGFFEFLAASRPPDEALVEGLDLLLEACGGLRRKAQNLGGMRRRAGLLLSAWNGPPQEMREHLELGSHGLATRTFLEALDLRLGDG